jgi:hypothetical protein
MPRLQILQHKSYHPYLEKNKQRVREDEARAAAEEAALEQSRIDNDSEARLEALRKRAGSPTFAAETDDNLPSTLTSKQHEKGGKSLIERHREQKAREEKKARKAKERLDFDFPSETAKREKKREKKGASGSELEANSYDVDENGRPALGESWDTAGHVNLFADLERVVRMTLMITPGHPLTNTGTAAATEDPGRASKAQGERGSIHNVSPSPGTGDKTVVRRSRAQTGGRERDGGRSRGATSERPVR